MRLQDVDAVAAKLEVEQVGEGPAGGEGGAEHLGADQDRGAEHGQHVEPDDAAACGFGTVAFIGRPWPVGGRNVVDMGGGIKAANGRKCGLNRPLTRLSWSAARSRSAGRAR